MYTIVQRGGSEVAILFKEAMLIVHSGNGAKLPNALL